VKRATLVGAASSRWRWLTEKRSGVTTCGMAAQCRGGGE